MHNAELYQDANKMQRRDAEQLIKEYANILKWRPDGSDSILDIGCGSGDVTIDFVLPILPKNFRRLTGFDLSDEMVEYARNKYANPRITFEQFDIGVHLEKQELRDVEPFDHVVSFYCLHWVQNQREAVQNLHKLCKPDGDILLLVLAQHPVFEIYRRMARSKHWAKYMTDVEYFVTPYQDSENKAEEFSKLLAESGFRNYTVDKREKEFTFYGIKALKSELKEFRFRFSWNCLPFGKPILYFHSHVLKMHFLFIQNSPSQ